jgi:hypothetical protein
MDIFMLCIGVAQTVILLWTLVVIIKSQAGTVVSEEATTTVAKKRFGYWPVIAMAILAAAAWIPYMLHIGEPERVMAITAWGGMQDGCYVVVDGSKLQHYSDKYNVFLSCGISNPTVDQNQDTLIAMSSQFTVGKDAIPVAAKYPQALLDHIKSLATSTPPQPYNVWHIVFLFPKKGDVSRVKRMADVREFGGKLVNNCEPIE